MKNVIDLVTVILHTASWPALILFLMSLLFGLLIVAGAIVIVLTNIVVLFVNGTVKFFWKGTHQSELHESDAMPFSKEYLEMMHTIKSTTAKQSSENYLAGEQAEEVVSREVIENFERTKKHL